MPPGAPVGPPAGVPAVPDPAAPPAPPDLPGKAGAPDLPGEASQPGPPGKAGQPGRPRKDGLPGPADLPSLHDERTPLAATAPVSPVPPSGQRPASGPAGSGLAAAEGPASPAALDLERLASLVSDRMADTAGHRPDPAQEIPSAEQAVLLREKAPELYDLWLKIAQDKAETDNYVHRAPYEVPERLAHSGRPRALGAMIVVLAFCGYLASLGPAGVYVGGLIALLDLLVMLALFFGLRPEHLTESGLPRRRRLTQQPAPVAVLPSALWRVPVLWRSFFTTPPEHMTGSRST